MATLVQVEKANDFITSISEKNPYISSKMIGKTSGMSRKHTRTFMSNHQDVMLADPFYFGSNKFESRHLYKKVSNDEKFEVCKKEHDKIYSLKMAKLTENFTLINKRKPSKTEIMKIYKDYLMTSFPEYIMRKYKMTIDSDIINRLIS